MAEPYNYTSQLADIPTPQAAFMSGVMSADAIDTIRKKNEAEKRVLEMQVQMQQDLASQYKSPSVSGISALMVKYPQYADKFKPALESLTEQQKASRIQQANNIFMPLLQGRRDIALEQLKTQAEAAKNSGDENSAKSLDIMHKLISDAATGKAGDNLVLTSVGSFLAAAMGEKEFAKTYEALGKEVRATDKAPVEMKEATAKAEKAATEAKFAESEAVAGLEKKGWDIKKIQNDMDVARENQKIALINAGIARETNALKRDELKLKLDDHLMKREDLIRTKAADYESATSTIDNMLSTLGRIKNTDKSVISRATGPIASRTTTVSSDTADFEALVENLDAQTFLAQIPNMVGKGALSDAEGKKLTASLQNFSLKQSAERFMQNVAEAERLMTKARKKLAMKYGVPDKGPDLPAISIPAGQPTQPRNVTVDY